MGHVVAPGEEPIPYWVRLKRLRQQAGLSQPELYRESGVSFGMIRALETPYRDEKGGGTNRSRYPTADVLEKLSEALGVDPAEWPEYRLARARELLDERAVGLDQALGYLDQITEALRRHAAGRSATEAAQRAERRRKPLATPDEPRTRGEGQ